jgi:hypothetical protein
MAQKTHQRTWPTKRDPYEKLTLEAMEHLVDRFKSIEGLVALLGARAGPMVTVHAMVENDEAGRAVIDCEGKLFEESPFLPIDLYVHVLEPGRGVDPDDAANNGFGVLWSRAGNLE